ncbi:MAG: molybdenum cofactor biosynthesis protein B [Pseudomonadales bacterium]|nr:molybdenum cofactor biosynthesis protein B [Pseudomonadales bacterium]
MSRPDTLNCTVLTISDTRTPAEDTSGALLAELLQADGHHLSARELVKDNIYEIRRVVSQWIADPGIRVIITTGGTGFTGRDSTPEALLPLFDKTIDGFGELFRQISYDDIGASTIQSRCVGGLANATLIFALPGSSNAVRTGWEKILRLQLNINTRPCNFIELIPRLNER